MTQALTTVELGNLRLRGRSLGGLYTSFHVPELDALFDVFPDACVVWTHRDPLDSVASYSSLMSLNRRMLYGFFEPEDIGRRIESRFLTGVERAMEVRRKTNRESQFFDVDFASLVRDPKKIVEQICRKFDLPFDDVDRERVEEWLGTRRGDSRGSHIYRAETFGLEPGPLRERFSEYIDRFSITLRTDRDGELAQSVDFVRLSYRSSHSRYTKLMRPRRTSSPDRMSAGRSFSSRCSSI